MEPQNGDLKDEFPFQRGDFQVPAVNFQEENLIKLQPGLGKVVSPRPPPVASHMPHLRPWP